MAVDAALGDVNLAAAVDLREMGRIIGCNENAIGTESGEKDDGGERELARALAEQECEAGKENDDAGKANECGRDLPEVLTHADSHCGAEPSGDGVDPSSAAVAALCKGRGWRKQRRIGDQGHRVKRDANRIEERSDEGAIGIEQEQTCNAERQERGSENK